MSSKIDYAMTRLCWVGENLLAFFILTDRLTIDKSSEDEIMHKLNDREFWMSPQGSSIVGTILSTRDGQIMSCTLYNSN